MTLKPVYTSGSRDATAFIDYPNCTKCRKPLGMRPDWKEIKGKKYCNLCAKDVV